MKLKLFPLRSVGFLLLGAFLLGMSGCGVSEEPKEEEKTEIVLTGEMIPVADYQEIGLDLSQLEQYAWQGDNLIYLESVWSDEKRRQQGTLYRAAADGTGAPEMLYQGISEEDIVLGFAAGRDNALFFLEQRKSENGEAEYYLRKLDSNLQEVYLTALDHEDFQQYQQSILSPSGMYADSEGNLILWDYEGKAYLFDASGQYLGSDIISGQMIQGKLIDAGKQGCFLVCQDGNSQDPIFTYLFQKVDFSVGRLGAAESRSLADARQSSLETPSVLSGYDFGILISTNSGLYSYDHDTGVVSELFSWQSGSVNVDGSSIQAIRFLQEDFPMENLKGYTALTGNPEGVSDSGSIPKADPVFEAFSFSSRFGNAEIVRVGYLDRGYVPEKQTVTLGISWTTQKLGQLVRSFNRASAEYEVVMKSYEDVNVFTEELIQNPSQIPDILDISWLNRDMLEKKGLLEDLKPYLKKSDVIREEDILEAVLEACESDGKLTSMMTGFSIYSLTTSAETVPLEGWTYDQFFALSEEYPDSKLLNAYNPSSVWVLLSHTMDSYIDWEEGICHFDSPEFIRLLENINSLKYPENQENQTTFYEDAETRKLLKKEFLLYYDDYRSPYDYIRRQVQYKDKAWNVGFPTQSGELCFLLQPTMQFAIYGNSANKDGAWAFLEFMLSEEQQSWYGSEYAGFPVRKSAFDVYLMKPYSAVYTFQDDNPSEETAEAIRKMVEDMRVEQSAMVGQPYVIIQEEIQAYFAGDKTVEQCADIIQNRVQLYLDENF